MKHSYTRQRQGRDFSIINYLRNAGVNAESNNIIDGTIVNNMREEDSKKSILEKLEQCKEDAERNAVPVDGFEPDKELEV